MKEILLTYRLIFGQDKKSRKTFEKSKPVLTSDHLLENLCYNNWADEPAYKLIQALPPKSHYSPQKDFPYFAARLLRLQKFMIEQDPSDLWTLWYDRRDIRESLKCVEYEVVR